MTTLTPNPQAQNMMLLDAVDINLDPVKDPRIRSYVISGLLVLSLFIGGSFTWALSSKLDGAVVAPASLVVEGNRRTVEHLEGGIIRAIRVSDGDYVQAGQLLVELDSSDVDVDLNVLGSQLTDLGIRRARLTAQLSGDADFRQEETLASLPGVAGDAAAQLNFLTQKQLFEHEARARSAEADILEQRIISLTAQGDGLEEQRLSNARQLEITVAELSNLEVLLDKGLIAASRVNARRIEIERLGGIDASLRTQQIQATNQIGELRLSGLSQARLRSEALSTELAAVETQLAVVVSQFKGAAERQKRISVTAPASGRVVEMNVFTVGGVVRPGAPILDIVPDDEELIVEARVNTADIEKLQIGQATRVRLSAFDQGNVPEARGVIFDISADSLEDSRTGNEYYLARVKLDQEQPETVAKLELLPGMPADLFVNTGERTALSYLTKPLSDRIARTFIE